MSDHARLSPSSCDRWSVCPGSVQMADHFTEETSEHAAEGSAAHYFREQALLTGKDAADFIGQTVTIDGFTFECDAEMADFLQIGIDWIREQPGVMVPERRVDMSAWIKDCFGTADTTILHGDTLTVLDLKYGRGVTVDAENNKQMMLYALGAWAELSAEDRKRVTKFRLIIDQPRGRNGTWKEWTCDLRTILEFAEAMAIAAAKTEDPDAELVVSVKGCNFCSAASNAGCGALHKFCIELLEDFNMPKPDFLTPERRSQIIEFTPLIKKWIESVAALQLDEAMKGNPTPGFKAVATLGDRTWADPEAAEEFWKSKMAVKEIYTQKLKSPAQMEKVAGTRNWKAAQSLIVRPEGKPALVPLSDPREPLVPLVNLLDDLDEELDDLI